MPLLYRIFMRIGILWTGMVALIVALIIITNGKNLTPDVYVNWALFASPGLIAFALAWVVKPPA